MSRKNNSEQPSNTFSHTFINEELKRVFAHEAEALLHVQEHFPDNAAQAVEVLLNLRGRLVISGIGKSGLIARKLVATFSSMATPSLFLHPTDALHGDLGMVQSGDVCLMLSKSATGQEFEQLIPLLRAQNVSSLLMCCHKGALYDLVDLPLLLPFKREACTHNLAPTSSSTVMLAFGDALAVVVGTQKGFSKNDFARLHPAGALGKNLLLNVDAFMHKGDDLALLTASDSFPDLVVKISQKKLGVGIVVDEKNKLLGIVTDGDLRRACQQGASVFDSTASDIMTVQPKTVARSMRASQALEIMENFAITSLVVADDECVAGLVHIHDLIKAGIKSL